MRPRVFSGTACWDPRLASKDAADKVAKLDEQVNNAFDVWAKENPTYAVCDVQTNTTLYALGADVAVYVVTITVLYTDATPDDEG